MGRHVCLCVCLHVMCLFCPCVDVLVIVLCPQVCLSVYVSLHVFGCVYVHVFLLSQVSLMVCMCVLSFLSPQVAESTVMFCVVFCVCFSGRVGGVRVVVRY